MKNAPHFGGAMPPIARQSRAQGSRLKPLAFLRLGVNHRRGQRFPLPASFGRRQSETGSRLTASSLRLSPLAASSPKGSTQDRLLYRTVRIFVEGGRKSERSASPRVLPEGQIFFRFREARSVRSALSPSDARTVSYMNVMEICVVRSVPLPTE